MEKKIYPKIINGNPKMKKNRLTLFEALTLVISLLALINSQWPIKDVISPFTVDLNIPQYIYIDHSPTSPYIDIYIPLEIRNISSRDGVIRNIMISINNSDCDRCSDFNRSDVGFVTKSFITRYPDDKNSNISRESILPRPLAKKESTVIVLHTTYPIFDNNADVTDELIELKIAFLLNNDEVMDYYKTPIRFQVSSSMIQSMLQKSDGNLLKVEVENYVNY